MTSWWQKGLPTATFVAMVSGVGSAQAQIVNTEVLLRHDHEKPAALSAAVNVDRQQGNTNLFVFGASLAGRLRKQAHEGLVNGSHERSSAADELVGNRSFAHLRYRYYFTERVQGEAYGQIAQDRFRLMTSRFVVGAGPRFVPIRHGPFAWTLAFSHMYEVERLDDSADFDSLLRKRHRLSAMSSAQVEFDKVVLQQTFYVQPAWVDPSNIRVLHMFNAQVGISDYLSVTWSLEQSLDTIAPSDVRSLDVRFRGGLKLDL